MIDLDIVDLATLQIEGLDTRDYPDFCDAYFSRGNKLDGTPLDDDELTDLTENYPLTLHEMALNTIF
jgi:hypothetical protein